MFQSIGSGGASTTLTSHRTDKVPGRIGPQDDLLLARRFPDLTMQVDDPAPSRKKHDEHATDVSVRFRPQQIACYFIEEPIQAPCRQCVALAHYDECRKRISSTLATAYEFSPTFRRLFNRAWDTGLQHADQRWQISTDTQKDATAPPELRRLHLIELVDPARSGTLTYLSARGEEPLDWFRGCLTEVIRGLTDFQDDDGVSHPRGGVVEYTNAVLKEMGDQGPACFRLNPPLPTPAACGADQDKNTGTGTPTDGSTASPCLSGDLNLRSGGVDRGHLLATLTQHRANIPAPVVAALQTPLSPQLCAPGQLLRAYLHYTQNHLDLEIQPDTDFLKQDVKIFTEIARIENARKAELNLTVCESVSEAIALIENTPAPAHRRIIFRAGDIGPHFSFADISIRPGVPVSVILLESAYLGGFSTYTLYKIFSQHMKKSPQLCNAHMSIIDVNVQRSPADCLIFCFSFALKSHKHAALFSSWHDMHHTDNTFARPITNNGAALFAKLGFNLYPVSILPLDFIKHTQSREVIGRRLDTLHADEDLPARTLLTEKILAAERRISSNGYCYYLPSIEYKRRNLIARSLNILREQAQPQAASP